MRGVGTMALQMYKGNMNQVQRSVQDVRDASKMIMDMVPNVAVITRHVALFSRLSMERWGGQYFGAICQIVAGTAFATQRLFISNGAKFTTFCHGAWQNLS